VAHARGVCLLALRRRPHRHIRRRCVRRRRCRPVRTRVRGGTQPRQTRTRPGQA
jgi:hypothetical protein